MLNTITLMGRFVRDPELRRTGNGTAVTSFSIACDRDYAVNGKDKEVDFFECVAWRNTAEMISKHFSKGRMAVITGRLQNRPWTDKEGNKRIQAEVLVGSIYFADSKKPAESAANTAPAPAPADSGAANSGTPAAYDGFVEIPEDDDLPF